MFGRFLKSSSKEIALLDTILWATSSAYYKDASVVRKCQTSMGLQYQIRTRNGVTRYMVFECDGFTHKTYSKTIESLSKELREENVLDFDSLPAIDKQMFLYLERMRADIVIEKDSTHITYNLDIVTVK